jgi:hypothetical protein
MQIAYECRSTDVERPRAAAEFSRNQGIHLGERVGRVFRMMGHGLFPSRLINEAFEQPAANQIVRPCRLVYRVGSISISAA